MPIKESLEGGKVSHPAIPLKQKLTAGQRLFGTWAMLPSPNIVNVIGTAGLDFVIIDMEHGPMSFETVENMVRAAECTGCAAIIRLAEGSDPTILRGLEVGPQAVMVPHVSTGQEAERIAKATKYHPEGNRGLSPYTRNHGYTDRDIANSLRRANADVLTGILVEGSEGISNLDEIIEVPGIDLIYVGIYDLSQSVGLPGELIHRRVLDLVSECVQKIQSKGIAAGSFANNRELLRLLVELDFRFIAYLVDCAVLRQGYDDIRSYYESLSQ